MKYLFVNIVAGVGSTGRIAVEQCRALQAQGHTCVLAYGRGPANCDGVDTYQIDTPLDCKVHGMMTRLFDLHGFGSAAATRKFVRWIKEYDPDVIWLHNLHGYYLNIEIFFAYLKTCGKTIRWTLHDCWAFTGHCAHFAYVGCDQWKTRCTHCPQLREYPKCVGISATGRNFDRKRAAFTGVPGLTLQTPSHWMAGRIGQSFLKDYPLEVVYNTIDTDIFKPTPSDFRAAHGLQDKIIVLGVAGIWTERKGLHTFYELADRLDDRYKVVLVGLTDAQIAALPAGILGLPLTKTPQELAAAYTAADVYVNPSVEESFGLTAVEAHACGTPAVVYKDTACEEIAAQYGGRAVAQNVDALAAAIREETQ